MRPPRSVCRHRHDAEDRRPEVAGASTGGRRAPKSGAVDRTIRHLGYRCTATKASAGLQSTKSLGKGLGEDYGQFRRDEIDAYLGNPGQDMLPFRVSDRWDSAACPDRNGGGSRLSTSGTSQNGTFTESQPIEPVQPAR